MNLAIGVLLTLAALVHFPPVAGVAGTEVLERLYGVPIADPNLELLMRHRAVLFGLLGALLLAGAWLRPLRAVALVAGFVSVASFLLLAAGVSPRNAMIGKIVAADALACVALVLATVLHFLQRRSAAAPASETSP